MIFASGSPFKNVEFGMYEDYCIVCYTPLYRRLFEILVPFLLAGSGHVGHCNQGNNMYLFPGLVPLVHRQKELHTFLTGCIDGHEKIDFLIL